MMPDDYFLCQWNVYAMTEKNPPVYQGQDVMSRSSWRLARVALFLDDRHVKELQTLQRDTISN